MIDVLFKNERATVATLYVFFCGQEHKPLIPAKYRLPLRCGGL